MPKQGIHPKYENIHVKCACGTTFETRSTHKGDIVVENLLRPAPLLHRQAEADRHRRRVERFRRKFAKSDAGKAETAAK